MCVFSGVCEVIVSVSETMTECVVEVGLFGGRNKLHALNAFLSHFTLT